MLTMESLARAFHIILAENQTDMTLDEIAKESLEMASYAVVSELNRRMAWVPAYVFKIDNTIEDVVPRRQNSMVWDRRMVCLSSSLEDNIEDIGETFLVSEGPACFLDEDGRLVYVMEHRTIVKSQELDAMYSPAITYRRLAVKGDPIVKAMDGIQDLF